LARRAVILRRGHHMRRGITQPRDARGGQLFGADQSPASLLDQKAASVWHTCAPPLSKRARGNPDLAQELGGSAGRFNRTRQGVCHGANMQDSCIACQPPSASSKAFGRCRLSDMARTPHKQFVGNNLRLAIEAVAKSQADFARRVGVSQTKLGNWLRGDHYPDPQVLVRACDEYGLTMDWFYRGLRSGVAADVAASLRAAGQASAAAE
jgi:hypothetical protein